MSFPSNTHTSPGSDDTTTISPSPADILRNAATYLTRHGWTQGAFYANLHQLSPPACALGAIAIIANGEVRHDPIVEDDTDPCWRAVKALCEYLYGYETLAFGYYVDTWNDHENRTVDQVTRVLNNAADQWQKTHA
jgi:hypothetical protein